MRQRIPTELTVQAAQGHLDRSPTKRGADIAAALLPNHSTAKDSIFGSAVPRFCTVAETDTGAADGGLVLDGGCGAKNESSLGSSVSRTWQRLASGPPNNNVAE